MSSNSDYTTVLLEEIRDQNRAVLEVVGQIQDVVPTLATKSDVAILDTKVATIQLVLKDLSKDLRSQEARTSKLEKTSI